MTFAPGPLAVSYAPSSTVERYRVKECLDLTKYTHWLADHIKVT
jgi:hypothetical protein